MLISHHSDPPLSISSRHPCFSHGGARQSQQGAMQGWSQGMRTLRAGGLPCGPCANQIQAAPRNVLAVWGVRRVYARNSRNTARCRDVACLGFRRHNSCRRGSSRLTGVDGFVSYNVKDLGWDNKTSQPINESIHDGPNWHVFQCIAKLMRQRSVARWKSIHGLEILRCTS